MQLVIDTTAIIVIILAWLVAFAGGVCVGRIERSNEKLTKTVLSKPDTSDEI